MTEYTAEIYLITNKINAKKYIGKRNDFENLDHYVAYKKAEDKLYSAFTNKHLQSVFSEDTLLALRKHDHVIPSYRIVETFTHEDFQTCVGIDGSWFYPSQAMMAESFYSITGDRIDYNGEDLIDENLYYYEILESSLSCKCFSFLGFKLETANEIWTKIYDYRHEYRYQTLRERYSENNYGDHELR